MSVQDEVAGAVGLDLSTVDIEDEGRLASCFAVTELALASVRAAAAALSAYAGGVVTMNRWRTLKWFDMTLRPCGWELPGLWDAVAGDYPCSDGWIRLHTNAPHHRKAALSVIGCEPQRDAVAQAVSRHGKHDLESAVVAAGGCAAAMMSIEEWRAHPQGKAVAAEPLIGWTERAGDVRPQDRRAGLAGIRVLDLTRVIAGPAATRFLAGFGADVLRIDPPSWNEPAVEPEMALGKSCAGLDLRRDEDRAVFEHLMRQADILVHGYRPGALEGLGYGAEERCRLNPGLIEVSLNAYGHQGPWAGRRGFDSLVQMSCGIAAEGMARARAEHPRPLPVQALDHATGYLMTAAALRALTTRRETGSVLSARLALARTATLLIADGARDFTAIDMRAETQADYAPGIEETGWGPAQRLAFPVMLDGALPAWPRAAGPLRRDAARFRKR